MAARECRRLLDSAALRAFAPQPPSQWTLTPARSFTIFGLPVTQVRLTLDPADASHARFIAVIDKRSPAQVSKLVQSLQGEPIGRLSVVQTPDASQVKLSCTLGSGD